MDADDAKGVPLGRGAREIVVIVLGIGVLNPHVYLDTVVLVGGLSATHGEVGKYWFGAGAIVSSFLWFYARGYGARLLTPLFAKPRAWQILDILIAFTMRASRSTCCLIRVERRLIAPAINRYIASWPLCVRAIYWLCTEETGVARCATDLARTPVRRAGSPSPTNILLENEAPAAQHGPLSDV